jgi:glucan 1,3-beta-glucosidase
MNSMRTNWPGMVLVGVLGFVSVGPVTAQGSKEGAALPALRIKGNKILDAGGKPVLLRGVNVGNWLLLETHFSGFAFKDEKSLWAGLQTRFGAEKMREIREAFRTAWIAADDFDRIKKLGLNHVRVPFWYGLLEDDDKPGKYREDGWAWLDKAVDWSEKAGLYCILDMHGLPGGQSDADHAGEKDRNAFWTDPKLQERTIALWTAIARRYKGRSAIAAFDLMNEPMGAPDGKTLVAAQAALLGAVRKVDPNRLVIVEDGYKGLQIFPRPTGADKSAVIYSQHHYPTMGAPSSSPDVHEAFFRDKFPQFAREQARFDQPLYIGEWSVIQEAAGGGPMARKHIEQMESRGWSWALWIYKQTNKDPVHECWSLYRNDKPLDLPDVDKDDADKLLAKFAQFKTETMVLYEPLRKAVKGEN